MAEALKSFLVRRRPRQQLQEPPSPEREESFELLDRCPGNRWKRTLKANHQKLRHEIRVKHVLPEFYSFLTNVEYERVQGSDKADNVDQVDRLVEILLTKEEREFEEFLIALWQQGYTDSAARLAEEAGVVLNTSSGMATAVDRDVSLAARAGMTKSQKDAMKEKGLLYYPLIKSLHKAFYKTLIIPFVEFVMDCADVDFQRLRCVCEQVIREEEHPIACKIHLPTQRSEFLHDLQHKYGLWKNTLDYQLLREVIMEFQDESLTLRLEQYEVLLREKGNTILMECQREIRRCPDLCLELKAEHNTALSTLRRLKSFLVHDVGLKDASFAGFREGCIELFFQMSSESASTALDPLCSHAFRSKLLSLGVRRVTLSGHWVIKTDTGHVVFLQYPESLEDHDTEDSTADVTQSFGVTTLIAGHCGRLSDLEDVPSCKRVKLNPEEEDAPAFQPSQNIEKQAALEDSHSSLVQSESLRSCVADKGTSEDEETMEDGTCQPTKLAASDFSELVTGSVQVQEEEEEKEEEEEEEVEEEEGYFKVPVLRSQNTPGERLQLRLKNQELHRKLEEPHHKDMSIKKEKIEGHISNMGHLFSHTRDYKKHTYLAIPEVSVLKEGEGTPVEAHSEAIDVSLPTDLIESVRAVASTVAKNTRSSTAAVLREQAQALKESEVKKEEAANKELADTFGLSPEELDAQREHYKKLERQQPLNDQKRELYPAVAGSGASGVGQENFAGNQGGAMIQEYQRSPLAKRRLAIDRQRSEEHHPAQPSPHRPVSHNLDVGSAVELADPPGYGIIRWVGNFPGVDEDIAGVELDRKVAGGGDGSWDDKRYFTCKDGHAIFIVLKRLLPDRRVRRGHSAGGDPTVQALQDELARVRKQHEEALQAKNKHEELWRTIAEQLRALQPLWAIPATELVMTDTVLRKGAYGVVRVGVYHGDRVAVKRLHNVIASDYFHKMIQREMEIAARLRHPNLVRFIGAVTSVNLTIVSELMETSLRSELMHGNLKENHILPISRDVACALCYLHSLPEPIIHRDVSSANVLLNSTKGGWVAKLGDYGSANFQAKLQTVGPGSPAYAAPEASRPEEQGPKMDVYSYGVLVLEMCTGTLPDPRDLPDIQQAVHSWRQPKRQLGGLACQCTLQSSDRRPHMRNVVTQLNGM